MMHIDDRRLNANRRKSVERVVDESFPCDLDQGFGDFVRQRPHARAKPRGEDHGLVWRIF
jgi:methyl coenzyme M reductase subunit D